MKKEYIMPKAEEIEIGLATMLCMSIEFGDDATEPAFSSDLVDINSFGECEVEWNE